MNEKKKKQNMENVCNIHSPHNHTISIGPHRPLLFFILYIIFSSIMNVKMLYTRTEHHNFYNIHQKIKQLIYQIYFYVKKYKIKYRKQYTHNSTMLV